ncbi:MAG TPA: glycosyltransferase, partial [Polyangia bacterium]
MRILHVIHGYPPRYNAGSEVYTQTLSRALAARHEIHVFTRQEHPFEPDFVVQHEIDQGGVTLHIVNHPNSRDRYRHEGIDRRFDDVLDEVRPDLVHIGHLNHLSTSIVERAAARSLPMVCTLHDYWFMCPRGQFLRMHPGPADPPWPACHGQEDRRCAIHCYARYLSGDSRDIERDLAYWTDWVGRRMAHLRRVAGLIDLFIAPSQYLRRRFIDGFGVAADRITYLDYGFDHTRLAGRLRAPEPAFVFGYIGTHTPGKGIHHLLEAFGQLRGRPRLRIWGRARPDTSALRALADQLRGDAAARIEWLREYHNGEIRRDVLDRVDAIVVPSIWPENSPLVIHEALHARVPVITADHGGMREQVGREVNGLLFRFRDPNDLAAQMQRLADDPPLAARLGARGYLHSASGDVPALDEHVAAVENLYRSVIHRHPRRPPRPGPWRITFETNPDDCNLRCVMCERQAPMLEPKRSGAPRRMASQLIEKVLRDCQGTVREIIPSTMGEPLLYPEFDEVLGLCARYGVKLNLTTNGTFPIRGARPWARLIVPVTSDVKVSWNGAQAPTAERVMVGLDFARAVQSLRDFVAVRDEHAAAGGNRCRVTLQMTFLEANHAELPAIVELAASLGVDRVKGHHLWVHHGGMAAQSMRQNAASIAAWNEVVRATEAAVERCWRQSGARVILDNIFRLDAGAIADLAPEAPCPFLGREAWIGVDGRFAPCCAPDAERRRLGEFGDVGDLAQIWTGEAYARLLAG